MDTAGRNRSMLEGLVREGPFKWLLGKRSFFDDEFEEMKNSPRAGRNWIPELSTLANMVVRRCSRILAVPASELQASFNAEASDTIKHPSKYARNFLEYCCFRTLAQSVQVKVHLADKKFRRLTYDMMLAWETPASASQPLLNVVEELTVGLDSFSRIAPAVPIITNVVIAENVFEVLTLSTNGRLEFCIYDKYLSGLERAMKKMKTRSNSSLLSAVRSSGREKILEVGGTVPTQPVLEHVGISMWPGRLTLTDHALHFEAFRVVSYDKPKIYDLSNDLRQIVKPELTGPLGTRLFDNAVVYKSSSLSEPVVLEFPELKGHTRRDYWLAIIREILDAHRFVNKFKITGAARDEVLSKAVLGIMRLQAIREIGFVNCLRCGSLLMFNLCDQLPGRDLILEALANMPSAKELDQTNKYDAGGGMYSMSALTMVSNLGFVLGTSSSCPNEAGLALGEMVVGEISELERAVKESRSSYKKAVLAQETVDGVKVDGIDTNLAVMKELLFPVMQAAKGLLSFASWDDPMKSLMFCLVSSYVILREWVGYAVGTVLIFLAIFMLLVRCYNQERPVNPLKVIAPPPMNPMEHLLAVQNATSHVEQLVQDGNIVLLKFRALLLSICPQATERLVFALLCMALILAFIPLKHIVMFVFLETFTRYSPPRRASTERWTRRLRDWWFSVPAAPLLVEREKEDKKKK